MKMEYVNVNGYLIPKLENGPITDNTIGKYGMMRARYLDEHRPMKRDQMLLDGTLAQHLTNIDCEAHRHVVTRWNGQQLCKACKHRPKKLCVLN